MTAINIFVVILALNYEYVFRLHEASNKGEALFYELCAQNYSVGELCQALAKCDLPQILALFQKPGMQDKLIWYLFMNKK